MPHMQEVMVILLSYLIGCFSTAYYLVRWRTGKDIRQVGSGNAGARNAGRVLGGMGFVITLLGDAAKGFLALYVATLAGLGPWGLAGSMIAVVLGHLYPVQLRFRGGKGVTTAFGAMLVLDSVLAGVYLFMAFVVYMITRRFTLSGLLVIAVAPLVAWLTERPASEVLGIALAATLLIIAHWKNIRQMFTGAPNGS